MTIPAATRREAAERPLPADTTLLPVANGALLVSRSHAVFCPVPAAETDAVHRVLTKGGSLAELSPALLAELERHGVFSEPRPPEEDPPAIGLQLTNECNSACAYCCTNSGQPRAKEVTYDELLAVVEQIRETFGADARVSLLGGEPLLVPWALDLAEAVLDRALDLTIFSNGMLLEDRTVAERVAALTKRGAEVRISLGGPTSALCDGISGVSRFESAIAGLHALAAAGGTALVDLMLLPQHVTAVAARLPALRRRLPAGVTVGFGVLYRSGRERGEHMFGSAAELEAALDQISLEAGEIIPASERQPVAFRREGCSCSMGQHLNVRSDGSLFACFKMEECIGQLDTQSFAEAAAQLRAGPQPASSLPRCADCPLATLCGGGCRSENLLLTGNADEPPCDEWRIRVLSELLAEDCVAALDWPAHHLLTEAHRRGIRAPRELAIQRPSTHLTDT